MKTESEILHTQQVKEKKKEHRRAPLSPQVVGFSRPRI